MADDIGLNTGVDPAFLVVAIPQDLDPEEEAERYADIVEIIPGFLYLSDGPTARNVHVLRKRNIKHIVNCTRQIECEFEDSEEYPVRYFRCPVYDGPGEDLYQYFDQVYQFLQEVPEGDMALVHCAAGVSRSGTVMIAYCMRRFEYDFDMAFRYVRAKRPYVTPNGSFKAQLSKYEGFLRDEGILPTRKKIVFPEPDTPSDDESASESDDDDEEEEEEEEVVLSTPADLYT